MRENWRPTLPLMPIVVLAGLIYLLTYPANWLAILFGMAPGDSAINLRLLLLWLVVAFHGGYRVAAFHPFFSSQYRKWLSLTPWSCGQPLPQGPVHLIWTDMLSVAAFCLAAYSNGPELLLVPIPIFLGAYLILLNITFRRQRLGYVVAGLFLLPLTVYPYADLRVACGVLAGLYVLAMVGLHQYFKDFPWSTDYWTVDLVEEMKSSSLRQNMIGWPFRFLCVLETKAVSVCTAFVVGLLAVWWAHVLCWQLGAPGEFMVLLMCAINIPLFRTVRYTSLCRSPMNLLGRIATGRLIIPRHDKIYLAPICVFLTATVLPLLLAFAGFKMVWVIKGCIFASVFLALALPPTIKEWQLTGAHRASRVAQSTRVRPPQDRITAEVTAWLR